MVKIYFKDEEEMQESLLEWQSRLGLSDWFIGIKFSDEIELDGMECAGISNIQYVNKCGTIEILSEESIPDDLLIKQSQELVLIHELLHFKIMTMEGNDTIEGVFYQESQHQLVEELAKALFIAKYNLNRDWFIND